MEILIISDSHGKTSKFEKILKRHEKIEFIIHLGDLAADTARIAELRPSAVIEAVYGNCDNLRTYPSEKLLQYVGKRILITHGHSYGVKSGLINLISAGEKENADIILYGHTHISKIEMLNGMWVINPGSISMPKDFNKGTYGIMELSKDSINARILEI